MFRAWRRSRAREARAWCKGESLQSSGIPVPEPEAQRPSRVEPQGPGRSMGTGEPSILLDEWILGPW